MMMHQDDVGGIGGIGGYPFWAGMAKPLYTPPDLRPDIG